MPVDTALDITEFADLQQAFQAEGTKGLLARLADTLRAKKQYHQLFEALKMQVRFELGLPLLYSDTPDSLTEEQRNKLEDGLIAACREVGLLLLRDGKIREGWLYLRAVGDKELVAAELSGVEADDEHLEELIEVCLHEGVDTARGYSLVLKHYGTCNAITTFEGVMPHRSRREQQQAARLLTEHLHRELLGSVRADIARQEGAAPQGQTVLELIADRPWLFGEFSYHIDTTHLASVVRYSRLLVEPATLRLALDLTEYGRRLSQQFQFQGDEPFAELYPSHGLYLDALLGERVDEAIDYFREKADSLPREQYGPGPAEIYIDLLNRLGRPETALAEALRLSPPAGSQGGAAGIAPSLLDLAQAAGRFEAYLEHCRQRGDLLGFAAGVAAKGK
jgi:hypothetical protein